MLELYMASVSLNCQLVQIMAPPDALAKQMTELEKTGRYHWTANADDHFCTLPGENNTAFLSCYQTVARAKIEAHVKRFSEYSDKTPHSAQSLAADATYGGGHCHIVDSYHQNTQKSFHELLEGMLIRQSRLERVTRSSLKDRENSFENGDVLFINRYPDETESGKDPTHASPWHMVVVSKRNQCKAGKMEIVDLSSLSLLLRV